MVSLAGGVNANALLGFLNARVEAGQEDAFDRFVEASELTPYDKLMFTLRGPRSEVGRRRVDRLIGEVSVVQGARALLGWLPAAQSDRFANYVSGWLKRLSGQEDYNAVVDAVALHLHGVAEANEPLALAVRKLVAMRRTYRNWPASDGTGHSLPASRSELTPWAHSDCSSNSLRTMR